LLPYASGRELEQLELLLTGSASGTIEAEDFTRFRDDPLGLKDCLWPDVRFYDRQEEIILSVRDNRETYVVSGHQLGKDFCGSFTALWFYLTRSPCRIVTTSVKESHLMILWGELNRFIETSAIPLSSKNGGPLIINYREIKKMIGGTPCSISYLIGAVSRRGEGLAGHHAPHTLLLVDEASGVDDMVYERASTWAKKVLVIGNPYPSSVGGTFFEKAVKGGDIVEALS
jgi:phage terminase large subunit